MITTLWLILLTVARDLPLHVNKIINIFKLDPFSPKKVSGYINNIALDRRLWRNTINMWQFEHEGYTQCIAMEKRSGRCTEVCRSLYV